MSEHVTLEPVARVRVTLGDTTIAETTRGYVVHERGLPDRYYIPRADVRATLHDGKGAGTCPWKGKWRHLDVEVDGQRAANLAWTYFETTEVCAPMQDYVAFYESRVAIDLA
jgi:uncharacterized protein (DUF427 family)